ncbi:MAG: MBL fold metallo-hydrolase [Actinobacteria bacterium]|nr:MBL fold metallo-hydrolase [Actinomycetota bacterium]
MARNPGPYTGPGTNTWVLDDGSGAVTVIDPGPVDTAHARAIMEVVAARRLQSVLVTHTHSDHAPMANPLASEVGVPAVGYAPGPSFEPDIRLLDGARFAVGSLRLEVLHTPGHSGDHLCFRAGDVLFTGDHVIGGSTVMVEDMGAYLRSLRKVQGVGARKMLPGHGDEIDDPRSMIDWYLAHRLRRHQEVLEAIRSGCETVSEVVGKVYAEVDSSLHPLAARSVAAHVGLLAEEGRIAWDDDRLVLLPSP